MAHQMARAVGDPMGYGAGSARWSAVRCSHPAGLSVQPAMAGRQVHGGRSPRSPGGGAAAGGALRRGRRSAAPGRLCVGNQAGAGPGWAGLTGRDDRALGIDQHRLPGIQGRAGVVGHAGRPAPAGDRDHPPATQDPANQRVIEQVGEGGKRTLRRPQSYRATARTTGSETRRGWRRAGPRRAPGRARLRPPAGWQAATRSAAPAAPGDRRSARVGARDVHALRPGPPPACAPTAHRPRQFGGVRPPLALQLSGQTQCLSQPPA